MKSAFFTVEFMGVETMEPQVEIMLHTGWVLETRPGSDEGWAWVWHEKLWVDGTFYQFPIPNKQLDRGT